MILSWFSGGITSAVATKLAMGMYEEVQPIFNETGGHHPDMKRFFNECQDWLGVKIRITQNEKYKDHLDLCEKLRTMNFISGAECSRTLKKKERYKIEREYGDKIRGQVFGFEFDQAQVNRAVRFKEQNPSVNPLFPLIDKKLTKANCMDIILRAGIDLPEMYRLGYANNNCVGCPKGGMGYWNKIRQDFPEVFNRAARIERKVGRTCIKGVWLDELAPTRGRHVPPPMPECDAFCDIEAADILDNKTVRIMRGEEEI